MITLPKALLPTSSPFQFGKHGAKMLAYGVKINVCQLHQLEGRGFDDGVAGIVWTLFSSETTPLILRSVWFHYPLIGLVVAAGLALTGRSLVV
jgi:hypothetical protein